MNGSILDKAVISPQLTRSQGQYTMSSSPRTKLFVEIMHCQSIVMASACVAGVAGSGGLKTLDTSEETRRMSSIPQLDCAEAMLVFG